MMKEKEPMIEFERLASTCDEASREAVSMLRLALPGSELSKGAEEAHRVMIETIRQRFSSDLRSNEPASASDRFFASMPEMRRPACDGTPATPLEISTYAYHTALNDLLRHCFFVLESRGSRKPN